MTNALSQQTYEDVAEGPKARDVSVDVEAHVPDQGSLILNAKPNYDQETHSQK